MNEPKILITRPKMVGDEATAHTYFWGEPIIKELNELGYEVMDIKINDVTYSKVSNLLKSYDPNVLIHFGHGCVSSLIGQTECVVTNGSKSFDVSKPEYVQNYTYRMADDISCDSLCQVPSNIELMSNKIAITYACHTAKRLGVCAMKNGAKAYMGFNDYLIFMVDKKNTEKIFTDCIMTFTYSMLNGDTLGMAKDKTLNKFDEYITKYKNVKSLATLLLWDRRAFTVYGDENLTIFS